MNDLQIFRNAQFGQVRIIDRSGEPWFVAADVANSLDIQNIRQNLSELDDDEKGVSIIYTLGGNQEVAIINEPGLYSLIFRSRKPEARTFKRWITHEVIPSIRKTGGYNLNPHAAQLAECLQTMAKMDIYPDTMKGCFMAEATSALSGKPIERYLPPVENKQDDWITPETIGKRLGGVPAITVGKRLKAIGLHGTLDHERRYSVAVWNKSKTSDKQVVSYRYNPDVVIPALTSGNS